MSSTGFPPVKWSVGQALLPAHLTAQEDSLIADSALRTSAQGGLPNYGIAELDWDVPLLRQGSVYIKAFRLVLPNQQRVVDYPGNAHIVTSPVELGELRDPTIYYFVLEELRVDSRPAHLPADSSAGQLTHRYFKLVFSPTRSLPPEMEHLLDNYSIEYQGCLATFVKDEQDFWEVSDAYIPPLTQIGTSPFLQATLNKLYAQLLHYKDGLQKNYLAAPLPLKKYANISHCIRAVQQTLFTLKNLLGLRQEPGEIKPHPYSLYTELYRLYIDLKLYREEWPEDPVATYRHEKIHYIYGQLTDLIQPLLGNDNTHGRSRPFILKEGVFATPLPENTERHHALYFIIKLNDQAAIKGFNLPKVSCLSRLTMLYNYSLSGLKLTEVDENSISYSFGKKIQCFEIQQDQELGNIFDENSIAFYNEEALRGYDFFIYTQSRSEDKF